MSFLIRWWCWWPKWTVSIQKMAGTSPLFSRYDETFLSVTERWFISWTVPRESKDKIFGTEAAPRPLCSGGGGVGAISEPFFSVFLPAWLSFFLINFLDIFRRQVEVGPVLNLQSSAVPWSISGISNVCTREGVGSRFPTWVEEIGIADIWGTESNYRGKWISLPCKIPVLFI